MQDLTFLGSMPLKRGKFHFTVAFEIGLKILLTDSSPSLPPVDIIYVLFSTEVVGDHALVLMYVQLIFSYLWTDARVLLCR